MGESIQRDHGSEALGYAIIRESVSPSVQALVRTGAEVNADVRMMAWLKIDGDVYELDLANASVPLRRVTGL
jgi:hypothetical protein